MRDKKEEAEKMFDMWFGLIMFAAACGCVALSIVAALHFKDD